MQVLTEINRLKAAEGRVLEWRLQSQCGEMCAEEAHIHMFIHTYLYAMYGMHAGTLIRAYNVKNTVRVFVLPVDMYVF